MPGFRVDCQGGDEYRGWARAKLQSLLNAGVTTHVSSYNFPGATVRLTIFGGFGLAKIVGGGPVYFWYDAPFAASTPPTHRPYPTTPGYWDGKKIKKGKSKFSGYSVLSVSGTKVYGLRTSTAPSEADQWEGGWGTGFKKVTFKKGDAAVSKDLWVTEYGLCEPAGTPRRANRSLSNGTVPFLHYGGVWTSAEDGGNDVDVFTVGEYSVSEPPYATGGGIAVEFLDTRRFEKRLFTKSGTNFGPNGETYNPQGYIITFSFDVSTNIVDVFYFTYAGTAPLISASDIQTKEFSWSGPLVVGVGTDPAPGGGTDYYVDVTSIEDSTKVTYGKLKRTYPPVLYKRYRGQVTSTGIVDISDVEVYRTTQEDSAYIAFEQKGAGYAVTAERTDFGSDNAAAGAYADSVNSDINTKQIAQTNEIKDWLASDFIAAGTHADAPFYDSYLYTFQVSTGNPVEMDWTYGNYKHYQYSSCQSSFFFSGALPRRFDTMSPYTKTVIDGAIAAFNMHGRFAIWEWRQTPQLTTVGNTWEGFPYTFNVNIPETGIPSSTYEIAYFYDEDLGFMNYGQLSGDVYEDFFHYRAVGVYQESIHIFEDNSVYPLVPGVNEERMYDAISNTWTTSMPAFNQYGLGTTNLWKGYGEFAAVPGERKESATHGRGTRLGFPYNINRPNRPEVAIHAAGSMAAAFIKSGYANFMGPGQIGGQAGLTTSPNVWAGAQDFGSYNSFVFSSRNFGPANANYALRDGEWVSWHFANSRVALTSLDPFDRSGAAWAGVPYSNPLSYDYYFGQLTDSTGKVRPARFTVTDSVGSYWLFVAGQFRDKAGRIVYACCPFGRKGPILIDGKAFMALPDATAYDESLLEIIARGSEEHCVPLFMNWLHHETITLTP